MEEKLIVWKANHGPKPVHLKLWGDRAIHMEKPLPQMGSAKDALNEPRFQSTSPSKKKTNPKNEEIILVTKFSDTGLGYIVLMYEAQNFRSKSKQHRFGSYYLGLWLHCLSIAKPGSRTFSGDAICVYDVSEVLSTWAAKTSSLTWSNYDRLRPFWQWNNPRPLYGLLHLGVQFQLCADKKPKNFRGPRKPNLWRWSNPMGIPIKYMLIIPTGNSWTKIIPMIPQENVLTPTCRSPKPATHLANGIIQHLLTSGSIKK